MNDIIKVTVIRPKFGVRRAVEAQVGLIVTTLLRGWFLMLLIPAFTDSHPGYWPCVAGYFAARLVVSNRSYLEWTTEAPR